MPTPQSWPKTRSTRRKPLDPSQALPLTFNQPEVKNFIGRNQKRVRDYTSPYWTNETIGETLLQGFKENA